MHTLDMMQGCGLNPHTCVASQHVLNSACNTVWVISAKAGRTQEIVCAMTRRACRWSRQHWEVEGCELGHDCTVGAGCGMLDGRIIATEVGRWPWGFKQILGWSGKRRPSLAVAASASSRVCCLRKEILGWSIAAETFLGRGSICFMQYLLPWRAYSWAVERCPGTGGVVVFAGESLRRASFCPLQSLSLSENRSVEHCFVHSNLYPCGRTALGSIVCWKFNRPRKRRFVFMQVALGRKWERLLCKDVFV